MSEWVCIHTIIGLRWENRECVAKWSWCVCVCAIGMWPMAEKPSTDGHQVERVLCLNRRRCWDVFVDRAKLAHLYTRPKRRSVTVNNEERRFSVVYHPIELPYHLDESFLFPFLVRPAVVIVGRSLSSSARCFFGHPFHKIIVISALLNDVADLLLRHPNMNLETKVARSKCRWKQEPINKDPVV